MVNSRKLSDDEVEALMDGLEQDSLSLSPKNFDDAEVREFSFGKEDLSLLGDYYALRLINEKICRFTNIVIYAWITRKNKSKNKKINLYFMCQQKR